MSDIREAYERLGRAQRRPPSLARLNAMVAHYRREIGAEVSEYTDEVQNAIERGKERSGIDIVPFFREAHHA